MPAAMRIRIRMCVYFLTLHVHRAGESKGLTLLAAEAEALGTTMDALALAWVMSHEWVDVCLSGAATVEQASHDKQGGRQRAVP